MSRLSDKPARLMVIGLAVLIIAAALTILIPRVLSDTTVRIGDGVFRARVAKTENQRERGLSGINNLSPNQALLMVFPSDSKWGIWMKDMLIPLDIVWLDQHKQVVYIEQNVLPNNSTKHIFSPKEDARYVLEFPAGTVITKTIKISQVARFDDVTQGVK